MLNTFIEKLRRTSLQDANDVAELLASSNLPDPDDLRRQLAAFESQRDADDAAWERLDRTSNPRAFMEQQAIAQRRERLLLQIKALTSQIAAAEKRHAAFVALAQILDATDQQIAQASQRLYADVLIVSKDERRARLEALDGLVRLRARIAAALAVVSPVRKFRRAPDPSAALTNDLRAAADQIERTLGPGMRRGTAAMPDGASELIANLNGGTA
jgi:hypothetical protein